jgi:RNA polymerase sigma-70 factor (ECF subfamily)
MSLMAPLPSPESSFHALLREARNGSEEARWLVIQLFRKTMLAIANEQVNHGIQSREAPSDIVQQTIVEAQQDLDRFQGLTEGEMRAWLRKVLVRNISNVNRKYQTDKRNISRERSLSQRSDAPSPSIQDPGPSPSSVLALRETIEALELVIQELPDHYREIIHLRYRKGLSYAEIAQVMNRTELATRRLWSRVLDELSRRMKKHLR